MIQGIVKLCYPDFNIKSWHTTLIAWASLFLVVFINTVAARLLPSIEGFVLVLHLFGFFAILIPLVYLAEQHDASYVFGTFQNFSGWESQGTAWLIGLLSGTFTFLGYDGPSHMAEEVQDAARTVPWAMVSTILINGSLAIGMVMAFLFSVGDLSQVLKSDTGYNFIQVFFNATRSLTGTAVMTAILITINIFACICILASSSRITWAFARDHGLPFSGWVAKVR